MAITSAITYDGSMDDRVDIYLRGVPRSLAVWLTVSAQEAHMSRNRLILGFLWETKKRKWTARESPPIVVE